jgi:MFS family permease
VYYFPVILTESFGFSPRLALILSGVDFISLMFWGSCASLLIDRFGRKPLMLFGAVGCGICFTLVTVGLAIGTKPTLAMSVSFIFGYHLFYVSRYLYSVTPQTIVLTVPDRVYHSSVSHSFTRLKSTPLECAALEIPSPWSQIGFSSTWLS